MSLDLVTRLYLDGIRWFRSIAMTSPRDGPAGSGRGFGTERSPARVVFFSDAVFAIAVTLLVLNIHPPQDTRHLVQGLAALWPSYLAYAITFLLIGQVWANHHVVFDHIRVADRMVLFLNTLLLMDIAFLPFAASILFGAFRAGHGQRAAVVFYGVALEVAAILFNAIWEYARLGESGDAERLAYLAPGHARLAGPLDVGAHHRPGRHAPEPASHGCPPPARAGHVRTAAQSADHGRDRGTLLISASTIKPPFPRPESSPRIG